VHARRRNWRIADRLLTLAAVLGVVVLAVTVTAHVSGVQPLVVRSGSMEPTVRTGSMVLVRTIAAAEIERGDVVAVDRPDGMRVMHRVVDVHHSGERATLTMKGDANDDVDQPLVVDDAARLMWSAPVIGRASAFLATSPGGFALGCLLTGLAATMLRRRPD
jgi:signal peptidase I